VVGDLQQPAAGGADLALVEEDRVGGPVGGQVQVGVVEQDVGRLAAQLQQDLLDRAGGQGRDPPADRGRAGEGDLVDLGRGDQRLARLSPNPGRTLTTPSGTPASAQSLASSTAVQGVCSAGFRTTLLPAAR
jgi:hypothetical protein